MAAFLPGHRPLSIAAAVLLVGLYAIASRVEFELGPGSAVPTQLVLVPMLFLLPVSAVPFFVAAGFVVGLAIDHAQGKRHAQRVFVLLSYSWHSVGPALVLALFASDEPTWRDAPIYAAALAAQFALDLGSSTAREWLAFGVSPRKLLPFMGTVFLVDALLAPVAILIAAESGEVPYAALLALPLVVLLAVLARDRTRQIDRALELSDAYRGATREARTDPLTGVGNRLAWDEALAAAESGTDGAVSVIVADLDGLKLANDTRGHELGDQLLRALADVVRSSVRADDLVARIGGDEFGILMLRADEQRCADVARRIREATMRHPGVDDFPLSVSVGHATSAAAAGGVDETARSADMQMYLEKRARTPSVFELDRLAGLARDFVEAG